jgi:hypothetical protein
MRTTLDIDDAVLAAAKELAEAQNRSAGAVISELARKGLSQVPGHRTTARKSAFPVFSVPANARQITSSDVKTLIADEGLPARR